MDYRIYEKGIEINRIVADDDDVVAHICQENGWTFIKEIPEEPDDYIEPTPLNMSIYDVGKTSLESGVRLANGDMNKCRKVANDYAALACYIGGEPFEDGMVVTPGDIVVEPISGVFYLYCGLDNLVVNEELDKPNYDYDRWAVIPFFKNGYKVFPPNRPIKMYVEEDSVWWDDQAKRLYIWTGPTDPICDRSPIYGIPEIDSEYWVPYDESYLPSISKIGEKPKLPRKWPRIKPRQF